MPDEIGKRPFVTTRSYDIQLTIKKLDYSQDIRSIQIINSIYGAYPVVSISLFLDANDIILEKIFGKEPLYLTIRLIGWGEEKVNKEEVNFELIYISGGENLSQKKSLSSDNASDRFVCNFITIPRKSFQTMTAPVNDVVYGKTPRQIIEEIVSENTDAKLIYDTDGENREIIDQLVLPPTTIYKTIQYIDNTFGLFNGSSNFGGYCQYDNKLLIMNLSKRMTRSQIFTVYHLSTDSKENKDIIEKSIDGKIFYTYNPLKASFKANSKLILRGKTINHIIKPIDKLYHIVEQKMDTVSKSFGAIAKNSNIDFDPILENRVSYNSYSTGNGTTSDVFANSLMAKDTMDYASIELELEKNLPILSLINVGDIVKLIPKTLEYMDLSGKYLLKGSILNFKKDTPTWESTAKIVLIRTNKTI